MKTQGRKSDLPSLERKSLYGIFAPLDPTERLPRESVGGNRLGLQLYRVDVGHRRLSRLEIAGMLSLPALWLLLSVMGHAGASFGMTLATVIVLLVGLAVFAFYGRRT
jgi:hypothetical protein